MIQRLRGRKSEAFAEGEYPVNVLVADDSRTCRWGVATFLRQRGIAIAEAANGEEAWQLLLLSNFDLLITDHEMPRRSGVELLRALRCSSDPLLRGLPAILVSSAPPRQLQNDVASDPRACFLPKPLDFGKLDERLRDASQRYSQPPRRRSA